MLCYTNKQVRQILYLNMIYILRVLVLLLEPIDGTLESSGYVLFLWGSNKAHISKISWRCSLSWIACSLNYCFIFVISSLYSSIIRKDVLWLGISPHTSKRWTMLPNMRTILNLSSKKPWENLLFGPNLSYELGGGYIILSSISFFKVDMQLHKLNSFVIIEGVVFYLFAYLWWIWKSRKSFFFFLEHCWLTSQPFRWRKCQKKIIEDTCVI
jgi:hypothetical protein